MDLIVSEQSNARQTSLFAHGEWCQWISLFQTKKINPVEQMVRATILALRCGTYGILKEGYSNSKIKFYLQMVCLSRQ